MKNTRILMKFIFPLIETPMELSTCFILLKKKAEFKQFPQLKSSDPKQFKNINVLMLPFYLFLKRQMNKQVQAHTFAWKHENWS